MPLVTLADRVAVVTGAWRGLGRAAAVRLHERGACVAVNVRNRERAEALAHYEVVSLELQAAEDRTAAARLHRKIGALHWEAGDRERAAGCFAAGIEQLGEDGEQQTIGRTIGLSGHMPGLDGTKVGVAPHGCFIRSGTANTKAPESL